MVQRKNAYDTSTNKEGELYLKVKSVSKETFTGYVYNLTMEGGDANYIIQGVAVANCITCITLDG